MPARAGGLRPYENALAISLGKKDCIDRLRGAST
jgi:hypothetical protein